MWTASAQQVGMLYQQPLLIGLGVLCVVGGLPLAMNMIPPNRWGGVRLRKTLSDERIWYLANSYCGKLLTLTGIITIVCAVVLRLTAMSPATYGSICGIALFGGLVLTSVMTLIYVWRVQ